MTKKINHQVWTQQYKQKQNMKITPNWSALDHKGFLIELGFQGEKNRNWDKQMPV